ncbi:Agenet-like domain [Dillenia turbinata]|uniref:Agenet-like domain n=1 Tax=Dillenia turbinata TaxID=194707 RepID=A0AAN8VEP4_9MAGN
MTLRSASKVLIQQLIQKDWIAMFNEHELQVVLIESGIIAVFNVALVVNYITSSGEIEAKPRKIKLKIKLSSRTSEASFSEGTLVEIGSDEEGSHGSYYGATIIGLLGMIGEKIEGEVQQWDKLDVRSDEDFLASWYTAVIIGLIGSNKFLVQYQTSKTDDESQFLVEEADLGHIRPIPPLPQKKKKFTLNLLNDSKILMLGTMRDGGWYVVYFRSTEEEMVFRHSKLRPRLIWINGKWVASEA